MEEVSSYILVEWEGENKFSVLNRSKIVDAETRTLEDLNLIGIRILCSWKGKQYFANVIQCGEKTDLNHEVKILTEQIDKSKPSARKTASRKDGEDEAANIQSVLEIANINSVEQEASVDYKQKYEAEKERSRKFKNKLKNVKAELKQLKDRERDNEMISLGPTVQIAKSELDTIKTVSGKPTVFARNLMRYIFEDGELIGKSLFGRRCNANSAPPKDSVDPQKRDAIILQTLMVFCGGQPHEGITLKIHRSMGDFIREVNAKNNRLNPVVE